MIPLKKKLSAGSLIAGLYALVTVVLFLAGLDLIASKFSTEQFLARREQDHLNYVDFVKYYLCGKAAYTADAPRFYSFEQQNAMFKEIGGGADLELAQSIEYPPHVLPLMFPLAHLPLASAFQVWNILGWSMMLCGIFSLSRVNLSIGGKLKPWLIGMALLSSIPAMRTFLVGQPAGIIFGLICFYLWSYLTRRDLFAGILLALTTIKPQYAIFLLIPPLVARRYKTLVWTLITGIFLLLLAASAQGFGFLFTYVHYVLHLDTAAPLAGSLGLQMVNLRGLFSAALDGHTLSQLTAASTLLGCLLVGYVWRQPAASQSNGRSEFTPKSLDRALDDFDERQRWLMAATVLTALFLGPHTHMYDCLLLGVPFCLTLRTLNPYQAFQIRDWKLKLFHLIALAFPIISWIVVLSSSAVRETYLAFLPYTIVNCVLWLLCIWYIIDNGSQRREAAAAPADVEGNEQ